MALIKCPECGNNVSDKSDKCIHCGFPIYMQVNISINKKKCEYCNCENESYQTACKFCGASLLVEQPKVEQQKIEKPKKEQLKVEKPKIEKPIKNKEVYFIQQPKHKWVALMYCIFLGYFGAHKFYEGKAAAGILYFFTFGLFGVVWIYDIITLLFKPTFYYV